MATSSKDGKAAKRASSSGVNATRSSKTGRFALSGQELAARTVRSGRSAEERRRAIAAARARHTPAAPGGVQADAD